MRLDVVFSPQELTPGEVTDRTVVVVDVLRATTTICAAMHHGARAVITAADPAEAAQIAQTLGSSDVVLAGERNSLRIPGFQLGNSPLEMTREAVGGKTLVMTTTNGTPAFLATAGAREVIVGAAVNLSVAGERARAALEAEGDLLILCAGREHGFGLDDAYLAGCLAVRALGGRRRRKGLNDAALVSVDLVSRYRDRIERVLSLSHAGRQSVTQGFRDDVHAAAQVDRHPVLPIFHERRIALADTMSPAA
jgi:2-phosphosulfolactate phosphatase